MLPASITRLAKSGACVSVGPPPEASGPSIGSNGLPEAPTKEFADYPIVRRFTRALPLRRTSYEDEFYELRQEIRLVTSTFNKIKAEGRDPDDYLTEEGRELLFGV